ncbi:MAG: NlpC/P60 family protein [Patescibacteria group bacterium]|nr:NlpC/P60 family protein [Patescibacteria group bacterium]
MIITKSKFKKLTLPITILVLFIGGFFIIPSLASAKITDDFNNACSAFAVNGITWEKPAVAGEEINDANPGSCTVCPGGTTKCSDNICRISCVGIDPSTCTDGKKGVYIIGDNLTANMESEGNLSGLITALGWGLVDVNGRQGREIGDGVDVINNNKKKIEDAGAVVIALGTSGNGANLKQKMGIIFNTLQEVNPGIRYYFVNYSGSKDPDIEKEMDKRSAALSSFVEDNKKEGAMLIDWNQVNKSVDPPYTDADPAGIHPIGNYDKMAQAVAGKIGQMPKGGICSGGKCGERAVELAKSMIGDLYNWGGCHTQYHSMSPPKGCARRDGGPGYDCSGLVNWAWYWGSDKKVDILAHYGAGVISSSELEVIASHPSGIPADAKPGDVLGFFGDCSYTSHIGMYIGEGKMVHTHSQDTPAEIVSLSSYSPVACWTRPKSCK